jgi:WD40 repeat protein
MDRGTELPTIDVGKISINRAAFSQDGARLAVGGNSPDSATGVISLWAWGERQRIAELKSPDGGVNVVSFSPNGHLIAAGYASGMVRLWEVATLKERATFRAARQLSGGVATLAFSPKGDILATSGIAEAVVKLWDAGDGASRGSLTVSAGGVNALSFSPDGSLLAMAQVDGITSLWDVSQARQVGAVGVPGKPVHAAAFSGDGRTLASGGGDETVRLFDAAQALGHFVPQGSAPAPR